MLIMALPLLPSVSMLPGASSPSRDQEEVSNTALPSAAKHVARFFAPSYTQTQPSSVAITRENRKSVAQLPSMAIRA